MLMSIILPFDYTVCYSKRKTLAIHIKHAQVEVRAPLLTSKQQIVAFLHKKTPWITQHLTKQQTQASPVKLSQRESITVLGQTYQLSFQQAQPAIYFADNHLTICYQHEKHIQTLFEQWLLIEAEQYLIERTLQLAQQMGERQRISDIRFRKTRSKWGHCTNQGVIQFNWLIVLAPLAIIDYLIIHELSHLKHMNHSALFWQRVQQFCPDYLQRRQWLKENGHSLSL